MTINKILNSKKSVIRENSDVFVNVVLNNTNMLLPYNDINKIVNVYDEFNKERQNSTNYRLIGSIKPYISNVLLNQTTEGNEYGTDYLKVSNFSSFFEDGTPANEVKRELLKDKDGWLGFYDINESACNFIELSPDRNKFSFTNNINNISVSNWVVTITYPYTDDRAHHMVNNGLIIIENNKQTVGGREMTELATPVKHNLKNGDTVRITGTNLNGDYTVIKTGMSDGTKKDYYFVIDTRGNNLTISTNSRLKKVVFGQESEYYFRIFKKIKTKDNDVILNDDYELYDISFSKTIFNDNVNQISINEDVDISNLYDNLGRPLSEIYYTIIKTNSDNVFGGVKSGIEMKEFLPRLLDEDNKNIPVINRIHDISDNTSHTPLETNIDLSIDEFYGDVVEYNKFLVLETKLADISHRFTTHIRTNIDQLKEGYHYKPHHLVKIREYSNYVEQGDDSVEGIPSYAVNLDDGRYLWRDLLSIGFSDTSTTPLDYPFLNGSHYIHNNIDFFVKRQDPFGEWGILSSKDYIGVIGTNITNIKTNIPD